MLPWLEILRNTLIAFAGLSLHGLVFAMLLTGDKAITRASVARYFAYVFVISLLFSILSLA